MTTVGGIRLVTDVGTGPRGSTTGTNAGEQGLVIDYQLVNIGTQPALVEDRVPATLGSGVLPRRLDPERAWVYMVGGRVRVSKQGFSPAPGVRFLAAPVTGARLLEGGGHLAGRAWVPLPPRLDVPGPEFEAARAPVDRGNTAVEFCVQLASPANAHPSASDPAVLEVPATAPGPTGLICTPTVGLPRV